ncbi:MAG: pre-peptidase C-terminal domain-containing protein [Phycisphaerales bacterium]|nr:pre-peptidase C-terminal domain-containing protein [Phycisphaerales bacterium]
MTLDDLSITTLWSGLVFGSVVGETTDASDDMNGVEGIGSGGSWSGGDDVYTIEFFGGDLEISVLFDHELGDLDLYVWGDNTATTLIGSSTSTSDNEYIHVVGLAAGTYYISIDGWFGATNSYTMNGVGIAPSAPSFAVLAFAGTLAYRRQRG